MWTQASSAQAGSNGSFASSGHLLATISYRSRATTRLSESDLDGLVRAAQIRNRSESITGMVIYDDGRFMQWLEGPAESLKRVVTSINRDQRHTDIEILGEEPTPVRLFEGWDLKLAHKQEAAQLSHGKGLFASLLNHVSDRPRRDAKRASYPAAHADRKHPAIETRPSPDTTHGQVSDRDRSADDVRAGTLATLLLTENAHASILIKQAASIEASARVLFRTLFEPAARALGDFWADDTCTEFDVTMGLVRLQTAMRELNCCSRQALLTCAPAALVVPEPGEPHMLSAVLGSEILWQAGWDVRCEFPNTDKALQDMLADERFDALDVSLSPAMLRLNRVRDLADTISLARAASKNKRLAVSVSGRLFSAQPDIAIIGADASNPSSASIDAVLADILGRL